MYGLTGHTKINRSCGVVYRMEKAKNRSRKLNMEMVSVIMALAWPTMLEQLMQTAVQYIDTAMVGSGVQHLNKEKIAAGPIKPVFFCQTLQIICCMCCMFMI